MKKFTYIFPLAAVLLLSGCASRENRLSGYDINLVSTPVTEQVSPISELPEPDEEASAAFTHDTTNEAQDSAETAESDEVFLEETFEDTYETSEVLDTYYIDEYAAYSLTKHERVFTRSAIFVGDSICRGFSEYDVVSDSSVFARGSVAARNFFDFTLYYGDEEVDFVTVLERKQPKYVFLSMGMNDINLTDEETYCENYRRIIETALDNSDAAVFVSAITPINAEFSTNYRIDCFNVKMEQYISENFSERVYYVDFAKHLKDADGNLKDCFNGGDGIHLAPYAYYVALWEMNRTMSAEGLCG